MPFLKLAGIHSLDWYRLSGCGNQDLQQSIKVVKREGRRNESCQNTEFKIRTKVYVMNKIQQQFIRIRLLQHNSALRAKIIINNIKINW